MNCELNQTGKINEQNTAGRLEKQMRFILEIDKLKQVLRRSYIGDGVKEKAEREGITARKRVCQVICAFAHAASHFS